MKDRPGESIEDQLVPFLPRLRRFALTLCRSAHQADDLVQSACERALSSAAQFQQGTRFDSWMFRILRNLWIDDLRRKSTRGPEDDITEREDLAGSSGEAQAEARLFLREVTKAIDELAGEQREVLLLVCVEELSYRETADILDVPIGTVMSRLARARKALAEASGISSPPARSEK